MRKSNDSLFELIHHLTKGEKRHFHQFVRHLQKGDKSSLYQLFSLIEKQRVYDEAKLKKELTGKLFSSNFSQAKAELYKLLLKSLRIYHHNHTTPVEVNDSLSSFEILRLHGLYGDSLDFIDKFSQESAPVDYPSLHIQMNDMVFRNAIRSNDPEQLLLMQRNFRQRQESILAGLSDLIKIQDCFIQIYQTLRLSGIQNTTEGRNRLNEIISELDGLCIDESTPEPNRYWYWVTRFFYHYCLGDLEQSKAFAETIIQFFESKEKKDLMVYDQIVIYATNLFNLELSSENMKKALQQYKRVMEIWKKYPILEQESKFYRINSNLLQLYMYQGDFEACLLLSSNIEGKINFNTKDEHALSSLLFNIIWAHLFTGNFKKIFKYLDHIINEGQHKVSTDYVLLSRVIQMIVYVEDKNLSLLNSSVLSIERFLKKTKRMDPSLEVLISFFKNYFRFLPSPNEQTVYIALKDRILKIPDVRSQLLYRMPQVLIWIQSKITGESPVSLSTLNKYTTFWQ